MREVKLQNSEKVAFVDDTDFDEVNKRKWFIYKNKNTYYARTYEGRRSIKLHRFILKLHEGDKNQVDHINGNGLDCTRINMRITTVGQNNMNTLSRANSSSCFKGVSRINKMVSKTWRASIQVDGKTFDLGHFEDEEEAAKAYDKVARQLHKEYGTFNFPVVGERSALTGQIRLS